MIGLILAGHGEFANGLYSSLSTIAGELQNVEVVNFLAEDTRDTLKLRFDDAIKKLKGCKGIVIFTDISGGTPFNVAVNETTSHENVRVVAGTNIPMLLEANMLKNISSDIQKFTDTLVNNGKEQVTSYDKNAALKLEQWGFDGI